MGAQSLTFVVAGAVKELLLDTDPRTGRTAVRLDGRPLMRPLTPEENERRFSVQGEAFILRRSGDGFEVEAEQVVNADWATVRPRKQVKGWKPGWVARSAPFVGILLFLAAGKYFGIQIQKEVVEPTVRALDKAGKRSPTDVPMPPARGPASAADWSPAPQPATPSRSDSPASVAAPPPAPAPRTPSAPSTERPMVEMAPVAQVYVVNTTKKYYPPDCASRPDSAYRMARSLAISQGFTLAAECATKTSPPPG